MKRTRKKGLADVLNGNTLTIAHCTQYISIQVVCSVKLFRFGVRRFVALESGYQLWSNEEVEYESIWVIWAWLEPDEGWDWFICGVKFSSNPY